MELKRNPNDVAALIRPAGTIALCAHISPDGDTIGSCMALKMGLESLGKQVEIFCQDPVPASLWMVPHGDEVQLLDKAEGKHFDLLICVDVSDQGRMGDCQVLLKQADRVAQIDHHGTNPAYAEVNDVDPHSPATALLIKELLDTLDVAITRDIAICLYIAIATDTGNFAHSYTTAEAFTVMGELMQHDLPLSRINRQLFRQRNQQQLRLLSRALSGLRFYHNDEISVMTLTKKDFEECGAEYDHGNIIPNFGVDIVGVRMATMLREDEDGDIRVALRSVEPDRVDGVAFSFGGGGHAQASGCTITGCTLEEAANQVVQAMIKVLDEGEA